MAFANLTRQQKLAYGTVAILAVILGAVLIYSQVLKGRQVLPAVPTAVTSVEGLQPSTAAQGFDTKVLSDPRYQTFDKSLFETGRLPVPVPSGRGKPNLF